MNSRASKMTFWVTCVVVRTEVTHFRKDSVGNAFLLSDGKAWFAETELIFSANSRILGVSNQNRQVSWSV